MKKSKQIFFLSLLLVFVMLFGSGCDLLKNGVFKPDENYCDEYVCSEFDPIVYVFKNNLYYDYSSNSLPGLKKEGIVELNEHGSRFVLDKYNNNLGTGFGKFVKFKDSLMTINTSRPIDDEDGLPRADKRIMKFNTEKCEFELFSTINADIFINDFYSYGDTLYLISDDKIYATTDGVEVEPVFDNMKDVDEDCYSLAYNSDKSVSFVYQSKDNRIVEYNLTGKRTVFDKKYSKKLLSSDYLRDVVRLGDSVYYFDYSDSFKIYNVEDSFKMIAEIRIGSVFTSWCGCENTLYIGDYDAGIISVNLNSGKNEQLIDISIDDIYMLGDKWVYYVDNDKNLHRILSDGSKEELVYG